MQCTAMKAFVGMLAAALGAAVLLVVCDAFDGGAGGSEASHLSAGTEVEDDCVVCLFFDLDLQVDDD